MPTTISGVLVLATFLLPGYVHYTQRRALVPQRALSPLVELATMLAVSVATNAMALALFGLVRMTTGAGPDPRLVVNQGWAYAGPRLGVIAAVATLLLAASSWLAFMLARRPRPVRWLTQRFAPVVADTSAWHKVVEDRPVGALVHVGCDLTDGAYVAGTLDWYSTELEEVGDRDLVLAEPFTIVRNGVEESTPFARLVVSARDIVRMYVSYVDPDAEREAA